MAEWSIDVAVAAEPYFVPTEQDSWIGDVDGSVAIIIRQAVALPPPPLVIVARGSGHVTARVDETVVFGVYFSPNRHLAELEGFLGGLEVLVRRLEISPTDLSGRPQCQMGSLGFPPLGLARQEWAIAADLCFLNRGLVATCVRWNSESHVDVTFASPSIARRTRGWCVLEGAQTLSDHRCVRFELSASSCSASAMVTRGEEELPRSTPRSFPRRALKRLNKELLVEAVAVAAWAPMPASPVDVESEADWFLTGPSDSSLGSCGKLFLCCSRRESGLSSPFPWARHHVTVVVMPLSTYPLRRFWGQRSVRPCPR